MPPFLARLALVFVLTPVLGPPASAQERPAGLREAPPSWHALTGARLLIKPGLVIERGTLLLKNGLVVAAGADLPVPPGARVWKLDGATVLPGFIDLASPLGVPAALREPTSVASDSFAEPGPRSTPPASPPPLAARTLSARNPLLRAEQQLAAQIDLAALKPEAMGAARRAGFTAVLAAPSWGVLRGQGSLLALRDEPDPKSLVLATAPTQHLGWDLLTPGQAPSSLMGAIALTRQTVLDARWHATQTKPPPHATLAALAPLLQGSQLAVAQARDEQDLSRWAALQRELQLPRLLLQGNGYEYRQLPALRAAGLPLLLPLNFPDAPAASADEPTPLHRLQHWDAAPTNPAQVHQAGLRFAFTAAGLPAPQFWQRLRQALRRGLPADAALAALTTEPAALLGEQQRLGSLEPGKLAHLTVLSADPFQHEQADALLSFVGDQVHEHPAWLQPDPRGRWALPDGQELHISGTRDKPQAKLADQSCALQLHDAQWQLDCGPKLRVVAMQQGERLSGSLAAASGTEHAWQAERRAPAATPSVTPPATAPAAAPAQAQSAPAEPRYPYGAYGIATPPAQTVLLRGATLWTLGPQGVVHGADLLVRDGRIAAIGRDLPLPKDAETLDARGLHLTPGLIDAHSHIAIARGVNEFSDSVTAEVRVADVLDATDINIYRQLAGGVTTSNLLHGSANLIGGQSAVIKLRWGRTAPELLFREAPPSIKFALGENPKQANFGAGTRYPITRMGTEQMLVDSFAQAADYAAQKPTRRDLRLEALAEVLAGTRQIHIHSYRADEMRLFVRLAREWKLKVAAFQHGLEGYKLAGEIAALGAGLSSFSDWWGYKAEAEDAVVGNAAMLARAGVLTSLNSDDAELARRLNTEAAKAVRVGGLTETEALALVTLNPARQLGVGHLVGSLEVGKHADLALWSGPPLSGTSRVLSTWVDGRKLFDRAADAQLRQRDAQERERLLAAVRRAPSRDLGAPSTATASALGALLEQSRALAQRLHADYHDGQVVHECTEAP